MGAPAVLKINILSDFNNSGFGKADSGLANLAKKAALAGAALGTALGAGAFSAVRAAEEAERASKRLANVLQQTAGASSEVIAAVESQADALEKLTGIDGEVIKGGQAILGTFASVAKTAGNTGGVFDRATTAAADLAAAGFGSIESNATALGKALENPTKGLTALTRSGVTFTDAQKEQIKALQESGNLLGAQEIVLAAIEGQVGGTAAATATASDKMKTALGNLQESVGAVLLPVFERLAGFVQDRLIPAFEGFIGFVQTGDLSGLAEAFNISPDNGFLQFLSKFRDVVIQVAGWVSGTLVPALKDFAANIVIPGIQATVAFLQQYSGWLIPIAAAVVAVVAALRIYSAVVLVVQTVTKAWAAVQLILNAVMAANPIGLIVLAVVALVAAFVAAYQNSETFRNIVQGAFEAIKTVIGVVVDFFKAVWNVAFAVVKAYFETYKAVVLAVFNAVRSAVQAVTDFFRNVWNSAVERVRGVIDGLRGFFSGVVGAIRGIFSGVADILSSPFIRAKDLILNAWNFLKGAITNIGDGLKRTANSVIDVINSAIRLANKIPGINIPQIGGFSASVQVPDFAARSGQPMFVSGGQSAARGIASLTARPTEVKVYVDDRRLVNLIRVEVDGMTAVSPRVLSGVRG